MIRRKVFFFWAPVIAYAALIYFLSSLEGHLAPKLFRFGDKVLHLIEYLPFGYLTVRAVRVDLRHRWLGALLVSFFVVSLYALSDEFHQRFVPGRFCSLWDWVADLIGAAAGIGLYHGKNRSLSKPSLQP